MSKHEEDDMDYFSGDDNSDDSVDSKPSHAEEEEDENNEDEEPILDGENEEELHAPIVDEDDDEDMDPIYDSDLDEDADVTGEEDAVAEDDADDEEMTSRIRYRGGALESDDDDDEDDDEAMDEFSLQKFDKKINQSFISEFHPECFVHNYEEIATLTKVVRDNQYNIIDPLHKTNPFLTKYEKTRILGIRAKQINAGAKPFIKVPENIIDGYLIAEMELMEKRIPFVIKRPLPGGTCEYWKLQDLDMIGF